MRFFMPLKSLALFVLVAMITFFAAMSAKSVCSALEAPPVVATKAQPVAAAGDAPSAHHKLLYRIARDRAIAQYARDKGITRAAAREKADHIDDSTLHAAVQAAGLKVQALPVADKLEDFLQWVVDHQDLIIGIVKIVLTLLALMG